MIIVIWGVARVEVVKESEGSKVEGKPKQRSIVGIQDAICKSVGLPGGDGFGVTTGNFAIEACITVLFYSLRTFYLIGWDGAGRIDRGGAGLRCIFQNRWERLPARVDVLSGVVRESADKLSVASSADYIEGTDPKPGFAGL